MDNNEIARRISELTDEQRNTLYWLCEMRKLKDPDAAVFEPIDDGVAEALSEQELIRRLFSMAAATEHVYDYWKDHVDGADAEAAD